MQSQRDLQVPAKFEFHPPLVLIFASIIAIQVACILIFSYHGFIVAVGPLALLALLLLTAFSVSKVFYVLVFYIIVFEELYYAQSIPGLEIYYVWPVGIGIFALLLFYWIIDLLSHRQSLHIDTLGIQIIILLLIVLFGAVHGYLRGHDGTSWRWDILPYLFYLSYFIFMSSKLKSNPERLYDTSLLLSIPVALIMIYALSQLRGAILLHRVVTQNIHMMQFAIPYAGLSAIYSTSMKRKVTCTFLLPLFTLAVIISQQRALLFTIFLTSFVLFVIFFKEVYTKLRRKTKFLLIISIIAILTVPFLLIELLTEESLFLTLASRFYIFLNPVNFTRDSSWQIRWQEIIRVWPQIKNNLILGAGLGASTISRHRYILQITVDNSYVYLLWKTGLIGLAAFLSIYYTVIRKCRQVLKSSKVIKERIFAGTVLMNTIGLMLIGITNASIAHYRFIFIWLALIASIQLIAQKYE